MSDRSEIIEVFGEEVAASVDTPLVVIEGTKGDPGKDGITPTIGENGNWYLGSTDTGKPSRGATGPQGAPGKDGAGMDITGATVGQIAKITAVDASGVPTAWSPADMPSGGGSADAVLYTAQTLTAGQKQQARKNIEAADSVWPTITGPVALCPDNITDRVNAVQVTTTKDSDTDFTVTLSGLAGSTIVRVDGIRTSTYDDIYSAANVEFVLHAAYIVVENSQVMDYDFSEISEEYERGTCKIWLEIEGQDIRLASYKSLSNGALKLIFIDSSDGAGIEVHSVTVSESTAEYAVTSMANGNEVSY